MKKVTKIILVVLGCVLISSVVYFFVGKAPIQKNILWGVNFSQMQAEKLGLDWRQTYLIIINDLGAKDIKLAINWDWINGTKGQYYFNDVDWQVLQAENNGVNLIIAIGLKTPRWPECHMPEWAINLPKEEREAAVLDYLTAMVQRYKGSRAVTTWQIENEPFFAFGICPETDESFLKREVALVKSLDTTRPVIITDSGEFSLWLKPAQIGDIVGTTMYRKVWANELKTYFPAPFPPLAYYLRAKMISYFFGKDVKCVELQAEPWGPELLFDLSHEEQSKTMDLEKFKYNIKFAKETGWDTFYFWGAEWWYQMKEKYGQPEIWNEAKRLLHQSVNNI